MRHAALLDTPGKDGATLRAYLEASARRGNQESARQLEGPECPEVLAYLRDWSDEVFGRSGVDHNGLAPLTWHTLAGWAALTDTHPTPDEVRALFLLDAIRRHPEAVADAPDDPTPAASPAEWPDKKPEAVTDG